MTERLARAVAGPRVQEEPPPDPRPDDALLDAYLRGNEPAFRILAQRHAPWLFGSAYRQLRDRHHADDAVQIVFVLLAQRAKSMNGKQRQKLTGWLFQTLQYTIKNLRRATRTRQRHEQAAAIDTHAEIPTRESIEELAQVLDGAVATLPETYRSAVLLRFYQNLSFDEVAKTLAVTEGAARKRVERALELLRQRLGKPASVALLSATAAFGVTLAAPSLATAAATAGITAAAGTVPVAIATSVKGVAALMAATKLQTAAAVAAGLLLIGAPVSYLVISAAREPVTEQLAANGEPSNNERPTPAAPPAFAPPPVAPIETAPPDPQMEFRNAYLLADGQVLKHIPPPFTEARKQFVERQGATFNLTGAARGQVIGGGMLTITGGAPIEITAAPTPPRPVTPVPAVTDTAVRATDAWQEFPVIVEGMAGQPGEIRVLRSGRGRNGQATFTPDSEGMILQQENGELRVRYSQRSAELTFVTGNGVGLPLRTILTNLLNVVPARIDADATLLATSVPGDFVVRAGAPEDDVRAALEKILKERLGNIKLTFRDVERETIVLKGQWNYAPLDVAKLTNPADANQVASQATQMARIHLYDTEIGRITGSSGGSNALLIHFLQTKLDMPVEIQAPDFPANVVVFDHIAPGANPDASAVLKHFSEQTGLEGTKEMRKQRRLIVE